MIRGRRSILWSAALGFLMGAAFLAGGEEDAGDLAGKLRRLQVLAGQAMDRGRPVSDVPPGGNPAVELAVFAVSDLTSGIPWYVHPRSDWDENSEIPVFGGIAEERPQVYGTIEEIMELARNSVMPDSWDEPDVWINALRRSILCQQKPIVVDKLRRFLDETLRPRAYRSVTVEAEVVELPQDLARALSSTGRKELTPGERTRIDAALAEGGARRIFACRLLSLVDQKAFVWHGRQVAFVEDSDVEVAQSSFTSDPVIGAEQLGGMLSSRAVVGERADRIHLDIEFDLDDLDGEIRVQPTKDAGALQLPRRKMTRVVCTLDARNGAWAVAAAFPGETGRRLLLVRPTLVERTGGVR